MTVDAVAAQTAQAKKAMVWAGRIIGGFVVLFMLMDAGMKFLKLPQVVEAQTKLGYPESSILLIAIVEVVVTVLYVIPRTAFIGVILLTGLFGGTVASHLRVDDPLFSHVLFGVYLCILAWGGLWLTDARLRALIPLRRKAAPQS